MTGTNNSLKTPGQSDNENMRRDITNGSYNMNEENEDSADELNGMFFFLLDPFISIYRKMLRLNSSSK